MKGGGNKFKRKFNKSHVVPRSPATLRRVRISERVFALDSMLISSRVAFAGILLAAVVASVLFLSSTDWRLGHALTWISPPMAPGSHSSLEEYNSMPTLNVASRIYVISLPKSARRRLDMEQLRYTLGLDFTYVNGTEGDEDTVERIMKHVAAFRAPGDSRDTNLLLSTTFEWPQDVDTLVESESPLDMKGSDLWLSDGKDIPDLPSDEPLICAYDDHTLDPYSPRTPPHRLLTRERLACWHSHRRVIRSIADGQDDVSLVLEDDVDMELDIRQRLLGVWGSLPSVWDIVFLGNVVGSRFSTGSILTAA